MTQVKETRPKGTKVGHSKPTRPKLDQANLARACKRLALEIEAEQDYPEGRLTRSSEVGSGRAKVLFISSSFRSSTKAFSMGRASEAFFGYFSIIKYFDLCT